MAKKSNIRSIRFTDKMIEMIESQAGETFTAKFEALVTRCMWELPRKEQELKRIQERIDYERNDLKRLQKKKAEISNQIYRVGQLLNSTEYQLNRCLDDLEKN